MLLRSLHIDLDVSLEGLEMVVTVVLFLIVDFDGSDRLFLQIDTEDFIKDVVGQTSGFMPRDMHALIADAGASLFSRGNIPINPDKSKKLKQFIQPQEESDSKSDGAVPQMLGKENLTKALERLKKRNAAALGTPKVSDLRVFHSRNVRREQIATQLSLYLFF